MEILVVFATALEGEGVEVGAGVALELGVGKTRAAATVAAALTRGPHPDLVLLFGVCGAYPARHRPSGTGLEVGDLCLVGEDLLADEGVETDRGFSSLTDLELGSVGPFLADRTLTERAADWLGGIPIVRGATVSTCCCTEDRSRVLAERSGAWVETMEGAAVGLVCQEAGVPLLHLRCVSNLTGDRGDWRLREAAARVREAASELITHLQAPR